MSKKLPILGDALELSFRGGHGVKFTASTQLLYRASPRGLVIRGAGLERMAFLLPATAQEIAYRHAGDRSVRSHKFRQAHPVKFNKRTRELVIAGVHVAPFIDHEEFHK